MQARSDSEIAQPPQNVFTKLWDAPPLPNLSFVALRMKRERVSTECAVIVKKSNGASISISHMHNVDGFILVDGDGNVVREPGRDRDDNRVLLDAIILVRKLPLHWIRKFVLEDLGADEMSTPESFEVPPALVKLICSDMPNLNTLSLTRTCVTELLAARYAHSAPAPCYVFPRPLRFRYDSYTPCPTLKVHEMRHPV